MNRVSYPELDETVFSDTLENGLRLRIVQRRGFTKKLA